MSEALRLVPKEQAEANQSAVARLEAALKLAREGEFAGVAIVAIQTDGTNYSTFSDTPDRLKFIGLLDWVRWRMLNQYDVG
jgi:hypothetical protein